MANLDFRTIPKNRLHWYCGLDAASTLALYRQQAQGPAWVDSTWRRLHGPALHALGQVERWGAILSHDNVMAYDRFLNGRSERVRADLDAFPEVPKDLNAKSPKQLQALFFEKLKLKPTMRTKTGAPSCSDEALEELAAQNPTVECIPLIRQLVNARAMLAMYGKGQFKHIGYDGRVHTTYKLARTGRLRSAAPNLQNLKSQDDDPNLKEEDDNGRWARGCWTCPEGWVWINLDYSQVELRVAALLSNDRAMIAAFNSGVDFHSARASQVFGKPVELVTKLERRIAKVINFMIPYGAGAFAVAAALGITVEKAEEYIAAYMESAPDLAKWLGRAVSEGRDKGASWSIWAREGWTHKRDVFDIGEPGDDRAVMKRVSHAERVCKNNPVQNIANCFSLASLTRVVAMIEDTGVPAELNMTVHDNLALYVRADVWQQVARDVRDIMQDFDTGPVSLKVDVEMGERDLGHMHKVEV